MDLQDLSNSLGNKGVSLVSTGRSRGTSYTEAERSLAFQSCFGSLVALQEHIDGLDSIDLSDHDPNEVSEEVVTALQEVLQDDAVVQSGLASIIRAVYRKVEKANLEEGRTDDFPKTDKETGESAQRDHSSLQNLLRTEMRKFVGKELAETVFKRYTTNKKKKAG